jgi:hypothetical protein
MPVLPSSHLTKTVADVTSRARSALNDDGAQIWTDAVLMPFVRGAYMWLYGQIQAIGGSGQEITLPDIIYTPSVAVGSQEDLSFLLPVDLYLPLSIEFRLNTGEEYVLVDRRQALPSRTQQQPVRPAEWVWQGRTIKIVALANAGLFKIRYISLLPEIALVTDPIAIDNAVEALGEYTAYLGYRRRGQVMQAQGCLGSTQSRGGAVFHADLLLDAIIRDEQSVPRRGVRFGGGSQDLFGGDGRLLGN